MPIAALWAIGFASTIGGGILGYLKARYDVFTQNPTKTVLTSPFLLVMSVILAMAVFANFSTFSKAIKGAFK